MKRVNARGLPSKRYTRDCRPSWTPALATVSLSPPRTAMETLPPKTRAQPSPSTTMLDRSVYWKALKALGETTIAVTTITLRAKKQPLVLFCVARCT